MNLYVFDTTGREIYGAYVSLVKAETEKSARKLLWKEKKGSYGWTKEETLTCRLLQTFPLSETETEKGFVQEYGYCE